MGTHPIFESDFDCLTDENNEKWIRVMHYEIKLKQGLINLWQILTNQNLNTLILMITRPTMIVMMKAIVMKQCQMDLLNYWVMLHAHWMIRHRVLDLFLRRVQLLFRIFK